jgi:hypothetical protein
MSMEFVRLRLTLEPTLTSRTPTSSSRRGHGFVLRLVDGPAFEHDDPLLRAFAAVIALAVRVVVDHDHVVGATGPGCSGRRAFSEKTVESHLGNSFAALGASSRIEVARAIGRARS